MERELFIDKDMEPLFLELTDEEAGKVVKAIFHFSCRGEDTDFSGEDRMVRATWETIKWGLLENV